MSNTSPKRRNKNMWTWGIILVLAIIIISFFVSKGDRTIDPALFADVETFEDGPHLKGNAESGLVLIEYSDFQCPACKAAEPAVSGLNDTFGEQVAVAYRNFPLRSIHPNAQIGAQAAEAAAIQGKFWEMHDLLFENQDEWSKSFNPERYLVEYAETIGLNVDRFRYDLESDVVKDRVNADYDEAVALGLQGTPSFVYDGQAVNFNDFVNDHLDLSVLAEEETSV